MRIGQKKRNGFYVKSGKNRQLVTMETAMHQTISVLLWRHIAAFSWYKYNLTAVCIVYVALRAIRRLLMAVTVSTGVTSAHNLIVLPNNVIFFFSWVPKGREGTDNWITYTRGHPLTNTHRSQYIHLIIYHQLIKEGKWEGRCVEKV